MSGDVFFEIHRNLLREGLGRNKYTRKAFRMLPELDAPRILDVGCGTGEPTLELARLSGGWVIGLDIHQPFLDELTKKIERAGLTDCVRVVNGSMLAMDFPDASFDVIWAEGSIFVVGFERGLREWRRLIKPDGFLVVHEMVWLHPDPPEAIFNHWKRIYPGIRTVPENLERIPDCGYGILGHFALLEDVWWTEYYAPLSERVETLRKKYAGNPEALAVVEKEQREIDMYKKYQKWYGSAFFVMRKR